METLNQALKECFFNDGDRRLNQFLCMLKDFLNADCLICNAAVAVHMSTPCPHWPKNTNTFFFWSMKIFLKLRGKILLLITASQIKNLCLFRPGKYIMYYSNNIQCKTARLSQENVKFDVVCYIHWRLR